MCEQRIIGLYAEDIAVEIANEKIAVLIIQSYKT
jgi:hypothetical protein